MDKNLITFHRVEEFEKEFLKLKRKYRSLEADLSLLEKVIRDQPTGFSDNIVPISALGLSRARVFKVRKFRCQSLKGKGNQSGIRIIYGFKDDTPTLIYFIEIYFKADKENENKDRIRKYFD